MTRKQRASLSDEERIRRVLSRFRKKRADDIARQSGVTHGGILDLLERMSGKGIVRIVEEDVGTPNHKVYYKLK